MLARVFVSLLIGLCLTSFAILLMTLLLTARNLPQILGSFQRLLRSLLRGSFHLYNFLLRPVRVWVFQEFGFDIFHPLPRSLTTMAISLVIGIGLLLIFSLPLLDWALVVFALHGLFIGLAWEGILRADDFQMGVNLE